MPCCLAILRYTQCGHSSLFKAGCTLPDCTSICPRERQEILLVTRYRWSCQDCQTRAADEAEELRVAHWDAQIQTLEDAPDTSREMAEYLEGAIDALRVREAYEERTQHLPLRRRQAFEITWVEDWTARYAELLWFVHYDSNHDKNDELVSRQAQYLLDAKVWDLDVVMDIRKDKGALRARKERQSDLFEATVPRITSGKTQAETLGILAASSDSWKAK